MKTTIRELAERIQGSVVGDGGVEISAARPLHAAGPGDITFLEDPRRASVLGSSPAAAAVVPHGIPANNKPLIHVADPLLAFAAIFQHFAPPLKAAPTGIDARAAVHASVYVDADTAILPFACVDANTTIGKRCILHSGVRVGQNCTIGDDVTLHPNVVLYDNSIVGDRVVLHAGAIIGADGFGYRTRQGRHVKVPQLGNVVIDADVEIGANTTIDRGVFESTRIGAGTKIDNLVQIAHNCQIGKHNIFAGQVGIAGSCITGAYVVMGGKVGVRDHLQIGDGVVVGAQSGLSEDAPAGARLFGFPAQPERDAMRMYAALKRVPDLRREVRRILQHLGLMQTAAPRKAA